MIKIGNSTSDISVYSCKPKSKIELKEIIEERIKKEGINCDLNDIDVTLIEDMSYLFNWIKDFNGDISKWNVSNMKNARGMFYMSSFKGDISNWDVSNVKDMYGMFEGTSFNGDISKWNVSNVEDMSWMFFESRFNQDISKWNLNKKCKTIHIFDWCEIKKEFKPKII